MVFSAPDEDAPKRRKDRDSIYSKFYGETLYPEDGHEGSGIKKIPRLGQGWNTVEAMVPLDVKGIRGALKVAERSDRETGKRYIAAVGIDPLWNDAEFNMNTIDKMQIWEIEDLPGELYVPLQLMYWSLGPELHYFRDMYPDSSTSDGPTIASSVSAQRPNLQTYPLDASSSKFISSSCRRQLKESGVEYKTALKHHIGESIAAPQTDMQITDTGPDRHATRKNGTVAPPNANYPAVYD
jgi:hypothetical protein